MGWKLHLMQWLVVVSVGCVAGTMYTVGDSSGWDISTDLDSWVNGKSFLVGDSLLFQFSSYHSLVELQRQDFESCNTTNLVLQQSNTSSGNTTIPLTRPGDRFFTCGNSLHCLGGMKLQVHTATNQTSTTVQPSGSQEDGPTSSSLRGPSLANNIPSSASTRRCCWMLVLALFGCFVF
ncbi:hypothetical protein V2J09_021074 [Rumex salicifolius]